MEQRLPLSNYPFLADQELLAEDWLSKADNKKWDDL